MPQFTIFIASVLIALGVGGYFGTGRTSVTALIPAFFGLPMLVAGLLALKPALRKHCMHVAAALALLGFAGTAGRGVPALLDGEGTPGMAVYMQLAMAAVCLIFVGTCVKSFINARRSGALD